MLGKYLSTSALCSWAPSCSLSCSVASPFSCPASTPTPIYQYKMEEVLLVISRGQAFGDLALLMNYPRAANVRAITHVEMCVLSRGNFQAVLARYSEGRRHVVVDMLTSFMQSYEAAQSRCPLLEMVRTVYSPDAIAEVCANLPFLLPVLTARRSAERIYTAINVEIQDPTLKFGVDVNVREQLIELRDRQRRNKSVKSKLKHRGDSNALSEDDGIKNKTRTRVRCQFFSKPIPAKATVNGSDPGRHGYCKHDGNSGGT